MAEDMVSVTCTGPVNIAVVKYWGKRAEKLILPVNSSLSATLHQDQLRAKTTVAASRTFTRDRIWLNGTEQSVDTDRIQNVLGEIRRRARKRRADDEDGLPLLDWHVHICSENNFPTAAGLASSAAGFACLVYTLAKLYGVQGDLSEIARQGSGSASRSVYGGFVAWDMGSNEDGSDSTARQVVPEDHWSELRILILVVSAEKKHVGSTSGMQNSVRTSELLKHRTKYTVPERMQTMTKAILKKDFQVFAEETMKDSNQMHAVCLDTYPPVFYLTDTSRQIIRLVHGINKYYGEAKVCYTFDAGPNACLYMPESSLSMVYSVIKHFYIDSNTNGCFVRGLPVESCVIEQSLLESVPVAVSPGALQYVISTKVGPGPQVLQDEDALLDDRGMPK